MQQSRRKFIATAVSGTIASVAAPLALAEEKAMSQQAMKAKPFGKDNKNTTDTKGKSGIMINWDSSAFWFILHFDSRISEGIRSREEALRFTEQVINQYEGSQVSDFAMNINCQISVYPSKVIDSYIDKYNQKIENGISVDYTDTWLAQFNRWYTEYQLDIFDIWLKRLKELNITSWISLRMNDVHLMNQATSVFRSDFWYKHAEAGTRVRHRRTIHRDDGMFDYGYEPYRSMMLDYINESLGRYDADGLELDWTRMHTHLNFQPGHEDNGVEILNGFMREVKAIAVKRGRERGRDIKISIRVSESPETMLSVGFDIHTWAKEGLIDIVIPTVRWETVNADIPVGLWKRLIGEFGVLIAPGTDCLAKENPAYQFVTADAATVAGFASSVFSAGADKIYLFNYFTIIPYGNMDHLVNNAQGQPVYKEAMSNPDDATRGAAGFSKVIHTCGEKHSAINAPRRHLTGFRSNGPFWEKPFIQVPRICAPNRFECFRILTGEAPPEATVTLILGINPEVRLESDDFEVYINARPAMFEAVERIKIWHTEPSVKESKFYEFKVSPDILSNANTIEVSSPSKTFEVTHIEIAVK